MLISQGGTVSNRGMKSVQMVIQKLIDSDARHGYTQSTESVPAIPSSASTSSSATTQQAEKALNLNTSEGLSSDDKKFDALQNGSKFCESQSNVNVAISAS